MRPSRTVGSNHAKNTTSPRGSQCILAQRGLGPGFLIHDSHLFDGVDGRQIGRALKVGAEMSEKFGFQYIVTMNSDQVPYGELPDGFTLDDAIIETKLTNVTDAGRLFGFRFG